MCACIVTLGHLRRAGRAGLEDNTTAVRGVRCEIYEAEKSWARWIPSVGGGGIHSPGAADGGRKTESTRGQGRCLLGES